MGTLYEDLTKIIGHCEDMENAFFHEDFSAYPNKENSFEELVVAQLESDSKDFTELDLEIIKLAKDITFEYVDNYGGEDCGRDYYYIWKFTRGDESVAIKFHGWYASHYGSEYEGYHEVKPVVKQVTVWE